MTDDESTPVVLVQRWHRIDVCAVLVDREVRWVVRDCLEAIGGDAGDYEDDPGHHPLVLADHVNAATWTLHNARTLLAGAAGADELLRWMLEREEAVAAFGYGNVVRYGTETHLYDGRLFTVTDAADRLNRDPAIDTGMQRLFGQLSAAQWIVRRGTEYSPAQSAIDNGLLAVRPRRLPHTGNPWPQIVLTDAGLTELHRLLGGTDSTVLEQEHTPR